MSLIELRYSLPSDTLIPKMYGKVKEKVTILVKEQTHVCITSDLWSSIAQDSYLSYIDSKLERKQACLHAVSASFHDSNTGERIASMITNCLEAC